MGRAMTNNVINMNLEKEVKAAVRDWDTLGKSLSKLSVTPAGTEDWGAWPPVSSTLWPPSISSIGYGIRYNFTEFSAKACQRMANRTPRQLVTLRTPMEIIREDRRYVVNFE